MNKEENFILFSDVKELFIRSIWIVLLGALLFGGIGFWERSQVPVKHKVLATFKDGGQPSGMSSGMFETILKNITTSGGESQGHVLITSSLVLESVIEKLGIQATVDVESKWEKKRRRFYEALRAEKGRPIKKEPAIEFENVHYHGAFPKKYTLVAYAKDLFELRDSKDRVLLKGEVGNEASIHDVTFTIKSLPSNLKLCHPYLLVVNPLQEEIIEMRSNIEVLPDKGDQEILELTLLHPDRVIAKRILNTVMEEYQTYLEKENQRVSEAQIFYLEKRRDQFYGRMHEHLQTYVDYLKKNLQEKGSLTLGQQLPLFQERKQKFSDDLMALNLKKKKLGEATPWGALELGQEVATLQNNMHATSKEHDELSLALLGSRDIAAHLKRLDTIDREKVRAKGSVDTFFSKLLQPKTYRDHLLLDVIDFGDILSPDAHALKKVQEGKKHLTSLAQERKYPGFTNEYLKNNIRLLSLQEEILKKKLFHGTSKEEEYRGIDITTARKLLLDYLHKRDDFLFKVRQMEFAKEQLEKEDLEYISLSEAFPDPISQGLVKEMGEMMQQLRKERSLTEKEIERLEKKFSSRKEDLLRHMKQTIVLTRLEKNRVEERIRSIQVALLDLFGQEISLIEKQIEQRIEEQLSFLDKEKLLVTEELDQVKREMSGVPDAWLREHELQFIADMNRGMLEVLVNMTESKNIESNLSTIKSKPIDEAYTSIAPKSPLLKIFGGLGAFIGALITFGGCFAHALYKGFPLTLRNMAARGKQVIGKLTGDASKDLEVLRNFSLLLSEQNHFPLVVTLILGKGEDYGSSLALLLAKEGRQILMIDLDSSKKVEQKKLPGLIQYLEGKAKEPSIRKKDFGDYIPMGGKTPFGNELLKSQKFKELLEKEKKRYDVIFLVLSAEAKTSLSKNFFSHSDVMTLRLKDESYSDLIPYFTWEDKGGTLAFLS